MTAQTKPLATYGPVQLGDRLGLTRFQVDRAVQAGLIPARDRAKGWSAAVVEELAERADQIRASVGTVPDVGAGRAAELLSERFGVPVHTDAILELSAMGVLPEVGDFKGWPVYCGRTLETFADRDALAEAAKNGALMTADDAAARLEIRRSDFDHLVRAGLLSPHLWSLGPFQSRRADPKVPLYRAGDLDAVAARADIDWAAVRSTPKGARSPLAKLPTAEETTA